MARSVPKDCAGGAPGRGTRRTAIASVARAMERTPREPVTHISQAYRDSVEVRGRDLAGDLMGRLTFTEYFHLLLTGDEPTTTSASSSTSCSSRSPSTG